MSAKELESIIFRTWVIFVPYMSMTIPHICHKNNLKKGFFSLIMPLGVSTRLYSISTYYCTEMQFALVFAKKRRKTSHKGHKGTKKVLTPFEPSDRRSSPRLRSAVGTMRPTFDSRIQRKMSHEKLGLYSHLTFVIIKKIRRLVQ